MGSPGGAFAGFAPAGPARLAEGLRCAHRRAGGNAPGPARPRARYLLLGPPRPQTPGFTFVRTKVNRKSTSPLWAGPRPFPNRTPAKERCAATEIPFCRWLLVIGAVVNQPCLTALESIDASDYAKQTDGSTPLTGRQPKLDAQPAADQMPRGTGSVAPQRKI